MASTQDAVWRAVHVYRHTEQDRFLIDVLVPTLADLRSRRSLRRAFFLRYWQGGPHVRIRLLLDPVHADAVQAEVTERFRAALRRTPVQVTFDAEGFDRDAQPTLAALEGGSVEALYPPDTVLPEIYRPELGKYGGPPGVAIAERVFDVSTAVVLAGLPALAAAPARRLGAGFTAMLQGMRGAGMTPAEMAGFLHHYCVLWSPYVFDRFLETWPDLLAARRIALLGHARVLLADPTDGTLGAALRDARETERADPCVLPALTMLGPDAPPERRRWALLLSYLHTHNNRLGLIPEQEAFLGYLGHHVLCAYARRAPSETLLRDVMCHRERRLTEVP
jgi:hypothetical protein